jgi:catechol 2,3-dioxygenase-like lactoylglutathione lyase family enzyme
MIDHVTLEVRRGDVAACVAFWELLGFHRVDPPDGIRPIATWVQRGEQAVHLLFVQDPLASPSGHVGVVCADFEPALERLSGAGFSVERHHEHWGAPRAYARDPVGHLVGVMEFGPGVRPPVDATA